MDHEERVDVVAAKIRRAWSDHREERYGDQPMIPWCELPERRRDKWRRMAQTAIEVIRS